MPTTPPLPRASLAKIPRQQRAIEMVHLILDAGIRVLEQEGVACFTTNRVADVAGISVGSLYQYFANKEMIIAGVVERGILDADHLARGAIHAASSAPVEAVVRTMLHALLAMLEPYRDLLAEILAATPILADRGLASVLETRFSDALRDILIARGDRYRLVGGPSTLYVIVNGAIYVALKWLSERPAHISREALVDALVLQLGAVVSDGAPRTVPV